VRSVDQFSTVERRPAFRITAGDMAVNLDRIDFISAYCDAWCERCPFTARCSSYAVRVAVEMCDGDFEEALELAVGRPADKGQAQADNGGSFLPDCENREPTETELNELRAETHARDERVDESPITTGAIRFATLAHAWRKSNPHAEAPEDARLAEALAVAGWDEPLIPAKLHRALDGHDEYLQGNGFDDDPVQNDWNGSAKVARISISRSIAAWTTIAEEMGEAEAATIAEELRRLDAEVARMFPDAMKFIRPGFDQRA
jgi:hypothetical protein